MDKWNKATLSVKRDKKIEENQQKDDECLDRHQVKHLNSSLSSSVLLIQYEYKVTDKH